MAVPAHEVGAALAGEGLQRHLEQLGESLFRITLLVKDLEQARSHLDTHSVAYTISGTAQDRLLWIDAEQSNGAALVLRQS